MKIIRAIILASCLLHCAFGLPQMDLKEFTSPLPKPWLNINANSVNVGPNSGGASSCVYSQIGTTITPNVTTLSSLSSNSAAKGSLTIGPLPIGGTIRLRAAGVIRYTGASGSTLSIALIVNGVQCATATNTQSLTIPSQLVNYEAGVLALPGGMAVGYVNEIINGSAVFGDFSAVPFALPAGQANVFDLGVTFNQIAAPTPNSVTCTMYTAEVLTPPM